MSVDRPTERELFLGASALPESERAGYLEQLCPDDAALRGRVLDLLREQGEMGAFMQTPAMGGLPDGGRALGPGGTEVVAPITEKEGDRIGRYKLLQKIGEGGCGVVYMTEQEHPVRRRVALKVIKLGMDTRSVIARFEAERQALAIMDHPNIAKVLDAGATDTGRPYFVMELVRGIRITDYCDQNNLTTEARLDLFRQVCHAIHHAHQKGIIHRDIKPSNILVTLHDGQPVPKVIDFGIAKATEQRLTEKTLFTEFTAFIGTPAYMSPEQAEMSGLDIDTRSDIYALGVLLYELLTGRTPFDPETLLRAGLDECRRTIREDEPVRPSTRLATMVDVELTTTAQHRRTESHRLIHELKGDLDWVVMKCLEKDRTRRYASANDLAEEIQHYLADEPVEARPPSNLYRLQKLWHRHRRAFSAAAAVLIILIAGAALSTWLAIRATRAEHKARNAQETEVVLREQAEKERERAERERASARLNEYVADINLAQQSLAAGHLGRALQLLVKHQPTEGDADLRGFEWRYLWQLCQGDEHIALPDQASPASSLAFARDGSWLAVGKQSELSIYRLPGATLLTNLAKGAVSMVTTPDGRMLVAASPSTVRAWDTRTWSEIKALPNNTGPVSLSADGRRLVTLNRSGVTVWDTADWRELSPTAEALPPMALSPDGKSFVAENVDLTGLALHPVGSGSVGTVILEDSTNLFYRGGAMFRPPPRQRSDEPSPGFPWIFARMGPRFGGDNALTFSPDGRHVVAPRNSLSEWGVFIISIWDARTGEHSTMPDDAEHVEHTGSITALDFSPDGRSLASASVDHSIRIWNLETRQRTITLQGHRSEVRAVAFSEDGTLVASGSRDGAVKLWPIRPAPREDVIPGTWQPLRFSADGRLLAALNRDRTVVFLNLATGEAEQEFNLDSDRGRGRSRFGGPAVAVTADLQTLACAAGSDILELVNTATHDVRSLPFPDGSPEALLFSDNGQTLVTTANRGRNVRVWNVAAGTNSQLETEAGRVLLSPDGQRLAVLQRNSTAQLWDLPEISLRTNLVLETQISTGAYSPDGKLLALIGLDDTVRLVDTATGRTLGNLIGHKQRVWAVAFTPDGKTVATVSDDSTLKLWNVATGQELLTIRRLGGAVRELLFSPDGATLVGTRGLFSRTGGLRFYRAPHVQETEVTALQPVQKPAANPLRPEPPEFPGPR